MVVLAAVIFVHAAAARNIPSTPIATTAKPNETQTENTLNVRTNAAPSPSGAGVKDKKNFITYGGIGGWAGVGYAGLIPTLGGIGGVVLAVLVE
ncbi:unnamed protein product [Coffea canephora]|uniref:Uncharacterized protein n=1 Tax=Coffea canephora TaxID=49390 RepID=A0A068TSX5_COFCA|nr:unnamed protein product [Coffea canephora]